MPKGVLLSVESSRVLRPHLKRFRIAGQLCRPTAPQFRIPINAGRCQLCVPIDRQGAQEPFEI